MGFQAKIKTLATFGNTADYAVVLLQHEVKQAADTAAEPAGKKRVNSFAALLQQQLKWALDSADQPHRRGRVSLRCRNAE